MNKSIKRLFTAVVSVLAFSFFSCHDAIFSEIRNEVELDDATVSGDVKSIVRYKDNIFVSNGRIYYQPKTSTTSIWIEFPTPGTTVYQLAADSNNLYAVSLPYVDDNDGYNVPSTRSLWKWDGSQWTCLLSTTYTLTYFFIFSTNTPQEANRKAFLRYGSNVYDLSDESIVENSLTTDSWTALDSDTLEDSGYKVVGSLSSVLSASYLNGNVILSSFLSTTSNETESDAATYVYTATGSIISYSQDGDSWTSIVTNSDTIISMGFSYDYMLLGTVDGIQHVAISDNIPTAATISFYNNAASALSSYYEVQALLVVDPSKSEYGTVILASTEFDGSSSSTSATLDNVGLWGYYPLTAEWNRQ